jgi:hypothetical protein
VLHLWQVRFQRAAKVRMQVPLPQSLFLVLVTLTEFTRQGFRISFQLCRVNLVQRHQNSLLENDVYVPFHL